MTNWVVYEEIFSTTEGTKSIFLENLPTIICYPFTGQISFKNSTKAYKFRSKAVRCNCCDATCVASKKNPELFFSQKMQRVLKECLMTIRF